MVRLAPPQSQHLRYHDSNHVDAVHSADTRYEIAVIYLHSGAAAAAAAAKSILTSANEYSDHPIQPG